MSRDGTHLARRCVPTWAATACLIAVVPSVPGTALVDESLVVDVGPSDYSSQVSHLYFLDRLGHPLVYFQYS